MLDGEVSTVNVTSESRAPAGTFNCALGAVLLKPAFIVPAVEPNEAFTESAIAVVEFSVVEDAAAVCAFPARSKMDVLFAASTVNVSVPAALEPKLVPFNVKTQTL